MRIARAACPGLQTLQHYLHDHLGPDDASRIDVHIDGCPACQGQLDELIGQLPDYLPGFSGPPQRAMSLAAEEPRPELPGFKTLQRLAAGGMGVVWRVDDLEFQRTLAVKVMKRFASRQPDQVQRFFQEARLCAQLAHPHIVPIHAMGRLDDGRPYYTMKLVEGQTLAERLARRESPEQDRLELLTIFGRICQAMAFAHRRGVIHRDLKPHNIMLGAHGEVQLMDWGLAKTVRENGMGETRADNETTVETGHDEQRDQQFESNGSTRRPQRQTILNSAQQAQERFVTQAGDVLGTLAYMPPEQARGEVDEIDCRSDVFGLGAILCEILTGAPPYQGTSFWSMRTAATEARLDEALDRLRNCGADSELIALAELFLAEDKADRPASAAEVSAAIDAYLEVAQQRADRAQWSRLAQEKPPSRIKTLCRCCRQRPILSAATFGMAMAMCALLIAVFRPAPALRVGIKPWVGFSPLAVADDLDLSPGIDVVLTPVEDHDDALQKLSRGEIDVVLCPLEGHVFARAAGHRTKAVLKLDDSLSADAIVARDNVRSPSDLIGKKVLFVQMDAPHYLLLAFAERHGLLADDVTPVAVKTAEEAVEKFIHGKQEGFAAVAIYEPYLQKALEQVPGAHLLTTAEREAGAIVDILTIDEQYLSRHPQHVEALATGWFEAIRLLEDRDQRALASACRFLGGRNKPPISVAQYDAMTAGMKYSDRSDNDTFFGVGAGGQSEFRSRMLAAHDRLSNWHFLRDATEHNPADADGSTILVGMQSRRETK